MTRKEKRKKKKRGREQSEELFKKKKKKKKREKKIKKKKKVKKRESDQHFLKPRVKEFSQPINKYVGKCLSVLFLISFHASHWPIIFGDLYFREKKIFFCFRKNQNKNKKKLQ